MSDRRRASRRVGCDREAGACRDLPSPQAMDRAAGSRPCGSTPSDRIGAVREPPYPLAVRVLGIDPGTAACGYGIVHASDGRIRAIDHGCWTSGARERPELRLRMIFDGVGALIQEHGPDAVALEESFVGADARIALFVGQARGAALVAAASAGVACTEYAPARETGGLRLRPRGQGAGVADGEDAARARHGAADLARGRRPRGRDLPRLDAAACPARLVRERR